MEPNGRITGWVNNSPSDLKSVGQIKFSEGLDRPNFQLADVNGDKKADLIWTDKFGGDARVWEMVEEMPDGERVSGSAFRWAHKGPKYLLAQRGSNQMFPNLGGQGRADMVVINPKTAHVSDFEKSLPLYLAVVLTLSRLGAGITCALRVALTTMS